MAGKMMLLILCAGAVSFSQAETGANPIRKIVTLLQNMQKEVEAEGKTEKE